MFRELTRKKQQLPEAECIDILKQEARGVLAVLGDDDYPYCMPLNHFYCPEDGKIYFHSGKIGHKVDAIRRHDKVSYCVYEEGPRKDGEWWLTFRSVIVFGRIEIIEDTEKIYDIARRLCYKFTDDEEYIEQEIERSGPGTLMFAVVPEHISGKSVSEK